MDMSNELKAAFGMQVGVEMLNSLAYLRLSMAARVLGFRGFAKEFEEDSAGERLHAARWAEFASRYNVQVPLEGTVVELPAVPTTIAAMFEQAADLERRTEQTMEDAIEAAEAGGDCTAAAWIGERLIEQQAERKQAEDLAARVADLDPSGLTIFDRLMQKE